jgi:hypothetical protein
MRCATVALLVLLVALWAVIGVPAGIIPNECDDPDCGRSLPELMSSKGTLWCGAFLHALFLAFVCFLLFSGSFSLSFC